MFDLPSSSPTVTSLFSGCGGLDQGFAKSGYKLIAAFDSDEHAIQAFNLNHKIKAEQVEIGEGFNIPFSSDVVIAGPPCQGFSTGGGYKDVDPRNALLLTTCRAIAKSDVKLAVIENVASLTNRKNKAYLEAALSILTEGGYYCEYAVLTASDFGVPQRRRRTVIIARSSARPFGGVTPIETPFVTVSDALAGLDETSPNHIPRFPVKGSKHEKIARRIGPDQKLCNVRGGEASVPTWSIPECFGKTTKAERKVLETVRRLRRQQRKRSYGDADPVDVFALESVCREARPSVLESLMSRGYLREFGSCIDLTNTFNGKYRRLNNEGVSPTVDTRFGDVQLFLHPSENRGLTVREAARIQGFDDSFLFPDDTKTSFRLIGNAVPPPMSEAIAQMCKDLI